MTTDNVVHLRVGDEAFPEILRIGIALGFSAAAGVAGEARGMNNIQVGHMLNNLAESEKVLTALTHQAMIDGQSGGCSPEAFKKLCATLMRQVASQRGTP